MCASCLCWAHTNCKLHCGIRAVSYAGFSQHRSVLPDRNELRNPQRQLTSDRWQLQNKYLMKILMNKTLFIILCIIMIFPHGFFNYFLPDHDVLKIITLLTGLTLISIHIAIKTPLIGFIKHSLSYGLILFAILQLSNLFTYYLIRQPKYLEHPLWMIAVGLTSCLICTLILTSTSWIIKKRLTTIKRSN